MATKNNSGKGKKQGSRPTEAELNEIRSLGGSTPSMPSATPSMPSSPAASSTPLSLSQRLSAGVSEVSRSFQVGDYEGMEAAKGKTASIASEAERFDYKNSRFNTPLNKEEEVLLHHWNKGAATNQWGVEVPGLQYLDPSDPQNKTILDKITTDLHKANESASRLPVNADSRTSASPGYYSPGGNQPSPYENEDSYKSETLKTMRFYKGEEGIYGVPKFGARGSEVTTTGTHLAPSTRNAGQALAPVRFNQEGELLHFGAAGGHNPEAARLPNSNFYPSSLAPTPATKNAPEASSMTPGQRLVKAGQMGVSPERNRLVSEAKDSAQKFDFAKNEFKIPLTDEEKVAVRAVNEASYGGQYKEKLSSAGFEVLPNSDPIVRKILQEETSMPAVRRLEGEGSTSTKGRAYDYGEQPFEPNDSTIFARGKEGVYRVPYRGIPTVSAPSLGFSHHPSDYAPNAYDKFIAPVTYDLEGNLISFGAVGSSGESVNVDHRSYPSRLSSAETPASTPAPAAPAPAQRSFFDPPDEEELRGRATGTTGTTPSRPFSSIDELDEFKTDEYLDFEEKWKAMTPEQKAAENRRVDEANDLYDRTPRAATRTRREVAEADDLDDIAPRTNQVDSNRRINLRPEVIDDRPESEKAEDGPVPPGLKAEEEEAERKATAARELAERKARVEEAKKADIPESDYEGRRTLKNRGVFKKIGHGAGGSVLDLAVGTLAGALIGGASAGMSYDSEKESDPYLKPFRIIGRATATLGGAVEGGVTGLATAGIAKMTQGVGGLFAGESAGETLTGSFVRGFRSLSGKTAAKEGVGGAAKGVIEGAEEIPYVAFAKNKGIDKELKQQARRIKIQESIGTPEALKKAEEGKKLLESARNRALAPAERESLRQNQFGLLLRDAPNILAYGAGVATAAPFATLGAVKSLHNEHVKEKFPGIFRKESIGGMDSEFYNSFAPKNMIEDSKAMLNGRVANASGAALYNVGMATIGATALFGMATAPFTAGFESSGMAGNANHPFNVIRNAQDPGATARAQMEADAANKVKMTKPNMIGLSDIDEAYFTNQSFRPTRGRHEPGKYNDDGNLVFALSALRRG